MLDHLDAEWRLFIELMALAGLRKTEAIEARVGDIDLDNGQLIVRGGDEGTKSGHHRIVPILSTRLHTTLSAAINTGKKTKRRQLIEHVEPRNAIKRAAEKGGVDKIVSPHRLRHGFASLVHAGGVKQRGASVRTVQAWMGHSTLSVTERYTHLARPSAEGEALFDRLGQVVGRWGV